MKIKEQTRKRSTTSKHRFEVVDRTDEGSSKYYFEVTDGSWRSLNFIFEEYKQINPPVIWYWGIFEFATLLSTSEGLQFCF